VRDYNSRAGFVNIEYRTWDAKLVESGRDEVCSHALEQGYEWLVMIDADAALFPPETLVKLLEGAYVTVPELDVLGAYANLKQPPYLPTIDTGTGKWETLYPKQGILPVIRTGAHLILVKTRILRKMGPPWFRIRMPYTPAKAFVEIDNFARITLDGRNPLASHPEWETLLAQAKKDSLTNTGMTTVGEDSGFCDAVKAAGGLIGVDSDLITGHVGYQVITFEDMKEKMDEIKESLFAKVGVIGYV
jgi:hypothetical protein